MAFDKHKVPGQGIAEHDTANEKKTKKKKPFQEGTHSDKEINLDAYDKEQKNDKELGEKKPGK